MAAGLFLEHLKFLKEKLSAYRAVFPTDSVNWREQIAVEKGPFFRW